MAFKGTLKDFKVPDILQLISYQQKSGLLTFTSNDGFITLIFEKGLIVGVDSFPKKLELRSGSVLVKQDLISEEMLDRALSIQKRTNQKIGEILISMGLVSENTIVEALQTQATEIILSLFKWKKGEYNFKVIDFIDKSMKTIEPLPTDNIIMEGVQMLDEWPLIEKKIPDENMIFKPSNVESKNIKIVDENEDVKEDADKIYLTESETAVLKYINGKNTVKDLVEMGIFTKYKIYKSINNLLNKGIIHEERADDKYETFGGILPGNIEITKRKNNLIFYFIVLLISAVFIFSFFKPLKPFDESNCLLKESVERVISDGNLK